MVVLAAKAAGRGVALTHAVPVQNAPILEARTEY